MDNLNIREALKYAKKLNQKKYRNQYNQFLIEGYHLVEEAFQLNLIDTIFTVNDIDYNGVKIYKVTDQDLKALSNVETPQGIIAICNKLEKEELSDRVLLLDGIQDPGNLGTILRSAVAFGFNTVIAENTCDFYNDKVIRSSQGAIFKVNIIIDDLLNRINNKDYYIYSTDVANGVKLAQINFNQPKIMLILGNEGNGVREELKTKADKNIHIEMLNTESLNVSIAASIIMYEIFKG